MLEKKPIHARGSVYQKIKSYLLSGEVGPGRKLTQEALAGKLRVSRTPVREALHRLESEGLVSHSDTGGFLVSDLSVHELDELFDLRSVLEGFSVRFACSSISEEKILFLEQIIENSQDAHSKGEAEGIFFWNTEFHDTIHNITSERKRFKSLITNMREYVLRYRMETLYNLDFAQKSINAHRKILLAFQVNDPNLAEYTMRRHIQESKEDAMKITFGRDYRNLLGHLGAGDNLACMVFD